MLEIRSNGLLNSIQDLGRQGYLGIGVSQSGAMDTQALRAANALLGNQDGDAAIEVCLFPFRLRFNADMAFSCTGADSVVKLDGRPVSPWWARAALAGQELVIEPPRRGARMYVAVAGGLDVPEVLGSRSTDLKSGFGGLEGRGLRRGDILNARARGSSPRLVVGMGCVPSDVPGLLRETVSGPMTLRVLPAAQYDEFAPTSIEAFTSTDYRLTPDANRMGYRLAGNAIERVRVHELLSHGIVPGTVQVPPSGQPIIQLAEANTSGGYPKIANVIEADLWRLAQARIGQSFRFRFISPHAAVEHLAAQDRFQRNLRRNLGLTASG